MQAEEDLIRFKTDAWKGAGMVANYAGRMHENRGTNRLKNAVEVALCSQYVAGTEILDVGIGTGRGSLPLAQNGHAVTGLDVSQAMLDQCRREAAGTPIRLVQGNLTDLPFHDEAFDSLISLNVAVHFPNWSEALTEWARVVKPGGRLVFDVHSSDHLSAVASTRGCAPEDLLTPAQRSDPSQFMLRIGAHDVAAAAESIGLSIVRLVPYAAVLGGGNVNYWLKDSRLWGYLGDRALSWMAVDEKLFAFGSFLERDVVSSLSTSATGRFMVVLEKKQDTRANERAVEHHRKIDGRFHGGTTLAALTQATGCDAGAWSAALTNHLRHPQNEAMLAMALSGPLGKRVAPLLVELIGEASAVRVLDANVRQEIDADVHEFVGTWCARNAVPDILHYKGVDLAPALAYDLMNEILRGEFFSAKEPV